MLTTYYIVPPSFTQYLMRLGKSRSIHFGDGRPGVTAPKGVGSSGFGDGGGFGTGPTGANSSGGSNWDPDN